MLVYTNTTFPTSNKQPPFLRGHSFQYHGTTGGLLTGRDCAKLKIFAAKTHDLYDLQQNYGFLLHVTHTRSVCVY